MSTTEKMSYQRMWQLNEMGHFNPLLKPYSKKSLCQNGTTIISGDCILAKHLQSQSVLLLFFNRAWQILKILPRPWQPSSKQPQIRAYQSGTTWIILKGVAKFQNFDFSLFPFSFWILKVCQPAILQPLVVQGHVVPLWKDLIYSCLYSDSQRGSSTFRISLILSKNAILLKKNDQR